MKRVQDFFNKIVKNTKSVAILTDNTEIEFNSYCDCVLEEMIDDLKLKKLSLDTFPSSFNEALERLTQKLYDDFIEDINIYTKEDVLITTDLSSDKVLNFKGEVYSPVIKQDWRATKDEDYLQLELKQYKITEIKDLPEKIDLIVTRHKATAKILKLLYSDARVIESDVTEKDVENKVVAGVLPPNLISKCESFAKFTVNNFNYIKDSDMSVLELQQRGYKLTHLKVNDVL